MSLHKVLACAQNLKFRSDILRHFFYGRTTARECSRVRIPSDEFKASTSMGAVCQDGCAKLLCAVSVLRAFDKLAPIREDSAVELLLSVGELRASNLCDSVRENTYVKLLLFSVAKLNPSYR